jgi:hypothetical protein
MRYTVIDSFGEIVSLLQVSDLAALALNTPAGSTAVDSAPPTPDAYYVDGGWVERPVRPSPAFVWNPQTKVWVDPRTAEEALAQAKAEKRQELTQAWSNERAAGVLVGTKQAPTDAEAWTRYLTIKAMAADGGWVDIPIPLVDGTFELLTLAKANALWAAIKDMERALLAKLRDRLTAVQAASTVQQVQEVSWS